MITCRVLVHKLCSKLCFKIWNEINHQLLLYLVTFIHCFFFFKGVIAWRISAWDEIKAIANIIIIIIIIIVVVVVVSYETTSLRKLKLPFQLGLKFHFDSMDC